jgi:hypothetical protein
LVLRPVNPGPNIQIGRAAKRVLRDAVDADARSLLRKDQVVTERNLLPERDWPLRDNARTLRRKFDERLRVHRIEVDRRGLARLRGTASNGEQCCARNDDQFVHDAFSGFTRVSADVEETRHSHA